MLTDTAHRIRYRIAAAQARVFCHKFIVECPRCNGCAELIPMTDPDEIDEQGRPVAKFPLQPERFKCHECELTRSWAEDQLNEFFTLVDWFKELELYLQTICDDQVVWALNFEHHQFLQERVSEAISSGRDLQECIPSLAGWPEATDAESLLSVLARLQEDGAHHASQKREQQHTF